MGSCTSSQYLLDLQSLALFRRPTDDVGVSGWNVVVFDTEPGGQDIGRIYFGPTEEAIRLWTSLGDFFPDRDYVA